MGLGRQMIAAIERYQQARRHRTPGPIGDYWRAGGNSLLSSNLPVRSGALIVDAGGFEGSWSKEMLALYGCRALIIEPVPAYARHLIEMFSTNDRVEVVHGALFGHDGETKIGVGGESSGIFLGDASMSVTVPLLDVARILRERNVIDVACLKLNVEGSEYAILDRFVESGLIHRVRSILVQFHTNIPDHAARRASLQKTLALTHEKRFDFAFIWECWVRNETGGPLGLVG